ncbi:hypothetical protein [Sphingobacterium suaedae]|uniref:Uncharacterized protein n=1 Tax=Sphingobacterium suaedae TaxID=1686402 RepID=A0ABW5KJ74_9SPHI
MGIRYEKDTLLNWINEMGKFLRLLIERYEAFEEPIDPSIVENGYQKFFHKDRSWIISLSEEHLLSYVDHDLVAEQIRPLALLFLRDALLCPEGELQQELLRKSKLLLEYVSNKLGSFSFEDYGNLNVINQILK